MREFIKRNRKKIVFAGVVVFVFLFVFSPITASSAEAAEICFPGGGKWLENDTLSITKCLADAGVGIIAIFGTLLWIAGTLFNGAIILSVTSMSSIVDKLQVIDEVWTIIRDLANMIFIFILLYIAISTILGMGKDTKKLIINVVVVALLINFSLFFSKVAIDASNIVSLQFYKAFTLNTETVDNLNIALPASDAGISNVFMQATGLTTLYNSDKEFAFADSTEEGSTLGNASKTLVVTAMGSVFLLVMSFVFLAGAIMFFGRFIILILLMMLSPIALIGFALPQMKKSSDQWKEAFVGQLLFAPVFMILIYVVARIITSDGFKAFTSAGGVSESNNFATALAGTGHVQVFVNFAIVIGFALAVLVISKSVAGKSASGINSWATKAAGKMSFGLAGAVGRQTVGRAAYAASQSTGFQAFSRKVPFGRQLYGGVKGVSQASFDARSTGLVDKADAGKAFKGGFSKSAENASKKRTQFDKDTEEGKKALEEAATKTERNKASLAKHAYDASVEARSNFESSVIKPLEAEVAEAQRKVSEAVLPEVKAIAEEELRDAKERLTNEREILNVKKREELMAKRVKESADAQLKQAGENYLDPYYQRLSSPAVFTPGWWAKPGRIQGQPTKWESSILNFFEPLANRADKKALADIRKYNKKSKLERALDTIKETVEDTDKEGGGGEKKREPEKEEPDGS